MSSPETEYKPPTGIRWWPAIFIVSILGVAGWIAHLFTIRMEDETFQTVSIVVPTMLGGVLLSIWWMFFSRKRWGAPPGFFGWILALIIRGVILVILGVGVAFSLRFEGTTGDIIPMVVFV